jgi:hypothetical protein
MRRVPIPQRHTEPEPAPSEAAASPVTAPTSPVPGQKRNTDSEESDDINERLQELSMAPDANSGSGSTIAGSSSSSSSSSALLLMPQSGGLARKMRLRTSSCSSGLATPDSAFSPPGSFASANNTPTRGYSASPSASMGYIPDFSAIGEMIVSGSVSTKERERREAFAGLLNNHHWVVIERFLDPNWLADFNRTTHDPVIPRADVYGMKDLFDLLEREICMPLVSPEQAQCVIPNFSVVAKAGQGVRTAIRSLACGLGTVEGPMFNVITHRFQASVEARQEYGFFHDLYRIAKENAPCVVILHRMGFRSGPLYKEAFSRLHESLFRGQEQRSDVSRCPAVWTVLVDNEQPGKYLAAMDHGVLDMPLHIEPLVQADLIEFAMSRVTIHLRNKLADESDVREMLVIYRPMITKVLVTNIAELTQPMRDIKTYVDRLFAVVKKRRGMAAVRQDKQLGAIGLEACPIEADFSTAFAEFRNIKMGHTASAAARERERQEEAKRREDEAMRTIIHQPHNEAGHSPVTASNHPRNPPTSSIH